MLAVPMYLLYEGGLVMARIMLPEKTGAVAKEKLET
jgi:Sec-independent protein secretion pathway component TatC